MKNFAVFTSGDGTSASSVTGFSDYLLSDRASMTVPNDCNLVLQVIEPAEMNCLVNYDGY